MGIVARCGDAIVMSEEGRLGLSGPEVIETAHGVEEFDSRDRALVWRTTGGKHRYLLGDCDDARRRRRAGVSRRAHRSRRRGAAVDLESLEREHAMLARRLEAFGASTMARTSGARSAGRMPEKVPLLADGRAFSRRRACAADRRSAAGRGEFGVARVAERLFPQGHDIVEDGDLLVRHRALRRAHVRRHRHRPTTPRSASRSALAMARCVLDTVREHPGRPILFLVDTQGQRLRRRDELLGINRYMAHLACCVEVARPRGHPVLGARLRPGAVGRLPRERA